MRKKITSASLWFTVLSLTASALNFLYYPVVARLLNLSQFGDVQIGVSFIMQAAALFSSLNLVALFISAGKGGAENVTARLERILILPSAVGAALVVMLAQPISQILQLHDPSLLYLLALIFILNIPASTWVGTLQGEESFVRSGLIALCASAVKIIVSALMIVAGFGAHGAIIGILVGTACIIPLAYFAQKSSSLNVRQTFRLPTKTDFQFLLQRPSLSLLLLSFLLLALLSTFDALFAKIHLSPEPAGMFAQLSIMAKIPYFLATPVSIILFRQFINSPEKQAKRLAIYAGAVTIASVAIYFCIPVAANLLFQLKLEPNHITIAALLLLAFGAFSITNSLVFLMIARGSVRQTFAVAIFGFICITALLITSDASGESIAWRYAIGQTSTSLLALAMLRYTKRYVR